MRRMQVLHHPIKLARRGDESQLHYLHVILKATRNVMAVGAAGTILVYVQDVSLR